MAKYEVTIDDANVATYTAFCSGNVAGRLKILVDGDVSTALAYATQTDEVAKAAKVAQAETWEPTMLKYEKLEKADKDAVDAILAKVAAAAEEPAK